MTCLRNLNLIYFNISRTGISTLIEVLFFSEYSMIKEGAKLLCIKAYKAQVTEWCAIRNSVNNES